MRHPIFWYDISLLLTKGWECRYPSCMGTLWGAASWAWASEGHGMWLLLQAAAELPKR